MNLLKPGTHKRLNELIGFLWVVAAVLLCLSLLSYSPQDPSMNTAGIVRTASANGPTDNWVGVVGSYLADLLFQALGFGAFLLPIAFALLGWQWLRGRAFESPRQKVVGVFMILFAITALMGLIKNFPAAHEVFPPGGLAGVLLAAGLVKVVNVPGAFVLTAASLVVGTFLATPFTFSGGMDWAREKMPSSEGFRFQLPKISFKLRLPAMGSMLKPADKSEFAPRPRIVGKDPVETPATPRWRTPEAKTVSPSAQQAPAATSPPASVIKPLPAPKKTESATARVLSMLKPRKKVSQPVQPKAALSPEPIINERVEPQRTKTRKVAPVTGTRFRLPSSALLHTPQHSAPPNEAELQARAEVLVEKLEEFAVTGEVVQINPGPVVTTFEFRPEAGIKLSRITNLSEDLCLALRAESILIERIPGKSTVGIEVPNNDRDTIMLREIIESREFAASDSRMTLPLGKDLAGQVAVADLPSMPHLLVAGATGTGKSVSVNSIIVSILYKATPEEVKLILVDPKRLELGLYEGIPHLYTPIVTEPRLAANVLRNAVREMERRLKLLAKYGVRNLAQFNQLFEDEATHPGLNEDGEEVTALPYMVIIIDELADLMMIDSLNVESSITRLAQMARAVGIHLILATQRPSVDVITGLIKANFPARLSFRVATRVDSRTILDGNGAESLLGKGDMLYLPAGSARLHRIHGPLVSEKEIKAVCDFWRAQGDPVLHEEFLKAPPSKNRTQAADFDPREEDELYAEAVDLVVEMKKASTSTLQRRLRIGYGRAARLIDMMEQEGLVGPSEGSKPREVLRKIDPVGV
jgi:S-DNA-T family DNA segregation ATPase FtsK/SpoIIIE